MEMVYRNIWWFQIFFMIATMLLRSATQLLQPLILNNYENIVYRNIILVYMQKESIFLMQKETDHRTAYSEVCVPHALGRLARHHVNFEHTLLVKGWLKALGHRDGLVLLDARPFSTQLSLELVC
jgi:hypothetical protein